MSEIGRTEQLRPIFEYFLIEIFARNRERLNRSDLLHFYFGGSV